MYSTLRLPRWLAFVVVGVAAIALAIAHSASAKASAKKAPLSIVVITAVNTPIENTPEVWAGAQAAGLAINKAGGVNGRKVSIIECNNQSTANGEEACAREAVAKKAVAVLSVGDIFGLDAVPILAPAHIPWVGAGVFPIEQTSPDSFPYGGGILPDFGVALAYAKQHHMTRVGLSVINTAEGTGSIAQLQPYAQKLGITFTPVTYPAETTDYGPTVQQFVNAHDQLDILEASGSITPSEEQVAKQMNYNPVFFTIGAGLPPSAAKADGAVLNGTLVSSEFPPQSAPLPGIKQFNMEANAAGRSGVSNTGTGDRDDDMITTWVMVHGLAMVAAKVKSPTAKTMYNELHKTKNLNIVGLLNWSPGATGPSATPRLTNGNAYLNIIKYGAYNLLQKKPIDVFAAFGLAK